jgi:type II secretory pathway pseudopilin PulG
VRGHENIKTARSSAGFTIVELMIATLVFSMILLVVTTGIIQFTKSYYRGANVAKTQDAARSIIDNISQSIQYGNTNIVINNAGTPQYICAGGYKFIFTKGIKYEGGTPVSANAGMFLVADPVGTCLVSDPLPSGGRQLLNRNMRLTNVAVAEVDPARGIYSVAVTVAYGDNDLLCNRTVASTCLPTATTLSNVALTSAGANVRCKQQAGSEYCAVSTLSTTVKKRLQ